MKSAENFVKKQKRNFLSDRRAPQIRYNFEPAEEGEKHLDDQKGMYDIFIIYRNPEIILNKFLEQFSRGVFHPVLDRVEKFGGKVPGTVNEYLFASYEVDRKLERLDFSFIGLPVIEDGNLTNKYRKRGKVENYLGKFIDE